MKKIFLSLTLLCIFFAGCEKEQNKKLLGAYFRFTVNGTADKEIVNGSGLNNNIFDCYYKGDTALYVNVSELYEAAGFVIKGASIQDGVYTLDNKNRAYYTNPVDRKRYYTDDQHKGTLTIKSSTFQAKTMLNTLEGEFSFQGVDTATGRSFAITKGTFLMEKKYQ